MYFFFFKQKTAYEMRISDWSSDVCSSDLPIGAVMAQGKIVSAISVGSGFFQHGHTYLGHATACAAALAVQNVIRRDGLLQRVRDQGAGLRQRLQTALGEHPNVGDIRGRGLFMGVELVADRASKQPFGPEHTLPARV